jgi:transcription initiation factor TFIIA large subunit
MSVASLYRFVVDDVVKNIRAEFSSEGIEEHALHELQQLWETKIMQSGAVTSLGVSEATEYSSHPYSYDLAGGYPTNPYLPDHHTASYPHLDITQNNLYNMNSAAYLNGAPPHTDTTSTPSSRHFPTSTEIAANALRSLNSGSSSTFDPHTLGKPQQYMPAPGSVTGWDHTHQHQVNTNVHDAHRIAPAGASLRSILSNNIPQHDGANDEPNSKWEEAKKVDSLLLKKYQELMQMEKKKASKKTIAQVDGLGDDDDSNERPGDDDSDGSDSPKNDDEELDSDLDDEDDMEPETEHLVLCQFEKVTRIKNKRKCNLKDGIMHLHGRDSAFHKATAEFDW